MSNVRLTPAWAGRVLVVVALCITAIALMALYKDVDGTLLTGALTALGAIAGLGVGILLPK